MASRRQQDERSNRVPLRFLLAVRLSREHQDRCARGEVRSRGGLETDPARRDVQGDRPAAAAHVPLKGDYSCRDFERSARFHGVPYSATEPCSRSRPSRRARLLLGRCARSREGQGPGRGIAEGVFRRRREHLESGGYDRRGGVARPRRGRSRGGPGRPGDQGQGEERKSMPPSLAACSDRPSCSWTASRSGASTGSTRSSAGSRREDSEASWIVRVFATCASSAARAGDAIRCTSRRRGASAACSRSRASASSTAAGASA